MGFSSASCRSATIRRPAAYKAAALPAELRRRNRSGMRNGGWAMRAKEFLSCDRFMPPIANYLPFGNPAFRMWPLGPSCFDGIRTRITPKTGHPDRLNDEAMLRIRCWRGGSVQTTEVQGPRLDHRSTSPQYGSGRVAALTPAFPPVLSPGFEPGLDASLAHCLYRLGYESMRRQSAGICPRSPLWIRPLVSDPCTHACGGRAYCNTRHDRDHGG